MNYFAVAPFVHTEYDITQEFKLTAGLRFDYNHYDYTNNLADNSTDSSLTYTGGSVYYRPADRTDSFSHLSPKLSLAYTPNEETNIYIRYANGFRIPQASTLYSMKTGYTSSTMDPETSDTYEIGIKKAFSKKSFAELAVYYMSVEDTITRYKDVNDLYSILIKSKKRGINTKVIIQD